MKRGVGCQRSTTMLLLLLGVLLVQHKTPTISRKLKKKQLEQTPLRNAQTYEAEIGRAAGVADTLFSLGGGGENGEGREAKEWCSTYRR